MSANFWRQKSILLFHVESIIKNKTQFLSQAPPSQIQSAQEYSSPKNQDKAEILEMPPSSPYWVTQCVFKADHDDQVVLFSPTESVPEGEGGDSEMLPWYPPPLATLCVVSKGIFNSQLSIICTVNLLL